MAVIGNNRSPQRSAALGIFGRVFVWLAVGSIRSYQAMLRPLLAGSCKFYPSCSQYAVEALQVHGLWRGSLLAVRRVVRCHPFSPGGYDLVPPPDRVSKP